MQTDRQDRKTYVPFSININKNNIMFVLLKLARQKANVTAERLGSQTAMKLARMSDFRLDSLTAETWVLFIRFSIHKK